MAHIAEARRVITSGVGDASSSADGDTSGAIYVDGGLLNVA
jgi:hypothetical protein